jgi:two-component system, OmpR family, response regulator
MNDSSGPPLSVLVVDDIDDVAHSTAEMLTKIGHAVRVAKTGAAALRLAAHEKPDVVLLDIGLPDMPGWDVAARLRTQSAGKQPLLIAVTGYGSPADRLESQKAGFDLHLVKPADPAALIALLARVQQHVASYTPPTPEHPTLE